MGLGLGRRWGTRSVEAHPVREISVARAKRRRPRVTDMRMWVGLTLVVGSMFIGALVLSGDEDSVTVWQATRDLGAGAPLSDLTPVTVRLGSAGDAYIRADTDPRGTLNWPLHAGQLVPVAAVGDAAEQGMRFVSVPVEALHMPPGLLAGDVVDVWVAETDMSGAPVAPRLAVAQVRVADVSAEVTGLGGNIPVVLALPEHLVPEVVGAIRSGTIDLVAVPIVEQRETEHRSVDARGVGEADSAIRES